MPGLPTGSNTLGVDRVDSSHSGLLEKNKINECRGGLGSAGESVP